MTEVRDLRKEIIELLVKLPALQEPGGRRAVLLNSGLDEVLRYMDCTGTPYEFVTRTVTVLYEHGKLPHGQSALDALLQGTENLVGTDKQAKIEALRERLRTHLAELETLGIKGQIGAGGDFVSAEEIQNALCQFLKAIEDEFKYVPIFHPPHKIVLQDQYIPIEVTLEHRYRHEVETTWGYAKGEAEFTRAYIMKGSYEPKTEGNLKLSRAYAMKGFDEKGEETRPVQVPWQEVKQKHKRLIILADPGMGKTALLKMEAITAAISGQNSPPFDKLRTSSGRGKGWVSEFEVPLFFRLSEFTDTDEEIAEVIPRLLQRNYPGISPTILPLLVEKLKNGTCLLLLDALDEAPKEQRNPLADKLNRFARNYPCPIIITSRIVGYGGGLLYDAKEVEIVPFTRKQIEQYIEIWFKNLKLDKMNRIAENENNPVHPVHPAKIPDAKGLIHELCQKPQIHGLAQNPLLLSLLCSLYQEDELALPARRGQIYEQAVHYMLYDWRRVSERRLTAKALTDTAWIEAKLELLEHLAYQFSCEYKEIFSMRELSAKINTCKCGTDFEYAKTPDIIKELSEEDGIIQQLDGQGHSARYIFLHRTFQEYLTASYLNWQSNGIELASAHFWDFNWHETITLFAGLLDDPLPLLKRLTDEKDDIFSTLSLLAQKCHTEYEKKGNTLIKEEELELEDLMLRYLASFDILSNTPKHGRLFSTIADLATFEWLLVAIQDESKFVRRYAAGELGKLSDTRAIDKLLVALYDKDFEVRKYVVWALGRIGGLQAIKAIFIALFDENEDVRQIAAKSLGEIATLDVLEKLIQHPDIDIYDKNILSLAYKIVVRFSRFLPKPWFIPVYPELLAHKHPEFRVHPDLRKSEEG